MQYWRYNIFPPKSGDLGKKKKTKKTWKHDNVQFEGLHAPLHVRKFSHQKIHCATEKVKRPLDEKGAKYGWNMKAFQMSMLYKNHSHCAK